ncbi:hypothetical protein [Cellulomonas hominis]|nr:hypothetical protein [Cellulomonas hominis]
MQSRSTTRSAGPKSNRSTNSSTGWQRSRKHAPAILLDRCLSPGMARGLRTFGFNVLTLRDVYPDDGQHIPDTEWLRDSARHGYIVFTANPAIISVEHERAALLEHGAKVFCIANAQQTRDGRALIFGRHLLRILRRARRPGPCFWRLRPDDTITYDIP